MASLYEVLSNKYITACLEDKDERSKQFYRMGDEFQDREEFNTWYDRFCYDWYMTCKSLAKRLKV